MQAGRRVLLVAPKTVPVRMERIVVGWNNTREARRAIADALPLLKAARHVDVVEIANPDDLAAARTPVDEVAGWLGGTA